MHHTKLSVSSLTIKNYNFLVTHVKVKLYQLKSVALVHQRINCITHENILYNFIHCIYVKIYIVGFPVLTAVVTTVTILWNMFRYLLHVGFLLG
jgi:hypothetical protein